MRSLRLFIVLVVLGLLCCGPLPGCAAKKSSAAADPPAAAVPPLTPEQRAANTESFEVAWATVRDTHWDPKLNGLDWQAVHDELRPRVDAARTAEQFHAVMGDMIGRFQQSHFAIIPSRVYAELLAPPASSGIAGTTGIDARVVDGKPLVVHVEPGSPADRAGVKSGWQILRIGEHDVTEKLRGVHEAFGGRTMLDLALHATLRRGLGGPIGQTRRVTFRDGSGARVTRELALVEHKGKPYQLGIMPAGHIWFESRRLPDDIGYIAFNGFMDPPRLMPAFEAAIKSFAHCRGLVIDIRGNGGGIPIMATGMAGWLIDSPDQYIGIMQTRDTQLRFVINPRLETYKGPVAVLIDGSSASCAEIFPAGLRDLGRATLFGARTAGAVLPAHFKTLPNGDFFYYPIADYFSRNGERLEGVGVEPDVPAPHTQAALLAGRDNALHAAVDWITKQPVTSTTTSQGQRP